MERYLITILYFLLLFFIIFLSANKDYDLEKFTIKENNLFNIFNSNQRKMENINNKINTLFTKSNNFNKTFTNNSNMVKNMKRYYDNNKHNKSLYDNYSVKNFKQINVKYNIDKPFDIYSEIIEGNGKKTSGSISNMEDQIIRSYNTVKSKYKELKHHIDKLNKIK